MHAGFDGARTALGADIAVFDAHFHIIDPRFPLVANNGYVPAPFSCADYRARMRHTHCAAARSCPARSRHSINAIY